MEIKLTVVVLAKNEEKNIKDCLESLKWCDEVIVIDDYSEDGTMRVIGEIGEIGEKTRVFQRKLAGDFAAQRNFGLRKARGDWVLFIDADERISLRLEEEIETTLRLSKSSKSGFYLRRQDWFGGRELKYGETSKVKLLRLAKKGSGRWQRRVHETWQVKGAMGELKNPILHYPHPTVSEFLQGVNFYSTLHARALYEAGIKPNLFRLILNPLGKFFQNWLFRLGFLDGTVGLIVALMMSFHSFLARAKLYQLWKD